MKFFSWLGTFLITLLIIAAFTAPGEQKFSEFINKEKGGDTMSCKPIIGKTTDIKLFVRFASITAVSFCDSQVPLIINDKSGKKITTNYHVPKITGTESYLGLFGRFWKL